MHRPVLCLAIVITLALTVVENPASADEMSVAPGDWPWWRGQLRDGSAGTTPLPPLDWSGSENIKWRAAVSGRGHGSPTVVGNRVFLVTADEENEVQSVVCYDAQSGRLFWEREIHRGRFLTGGNKKASHASTTVACDGYRVFANFINADAAYTTALTVDGEPLWQEKISDYVVHQGYGSSPTLYESLVIVSADNKGGGSLVAFDRKTGKTVWRHQRPELPNYCSPVVLSVAGKDQLILFGCDYVSAFDPRLGKLFWQIEGATTECVTTAVTDGRHVFTSGGYPRDHISAVVADGSGKIAWENDNRVYVPSMLLQGGYLYAVSDAGVAMCFEASTGRQLWKGRLGGTFSSSPVLFAGHILSMNEAGKCFIFRATPADFELVATNQMGDEVFATPAISRGCIYMRVADHETGQRQEYLVCVGKN
ncbi:MAG: serine/threonine protein kinase [Planctomycetaceae bacterium]|nr:serine/threonine protein kinase [Planctomycetaceae bacterium]